MPAGAWNAGNTLAAWGGDMELEMSKPLIIAKFPGSSTADECTKARNQLEASYPDYQFLVCGEDVSSFHTLPLSKYRLAVNRNGTSIDVEAPTLAEVYDMLEKATSATTI